MMENTLSATIAFPLLGTFLTIVAFYAGQQAHLYAKRSPLIQPVLLGIILVIGFLLVLDVPYATYYETSSLLHLMLGPATVALAVPLFQNAKRIRELILPILCTVLVGGTLTVGLAVGILMLFDVSDATLLSMPTKSITTPIAMAVTEKIGGYPALSALYVLVTGAFGAMVGIPLMNAIGIKDEAVKGFTLGLTSHALGTVRALEVSEKCGAFSALAMGITGVVTSIVLPFLAAWL